MIRLGNLCGTIMIKDKQLIKFTFEKGTLIDYKLLCNNSKLLPLEFKDGIITEERLCLFWEARLTPDTRQNLKENMEKSGLKYYDAEQLIRHQQGRCIDDPYWLKCE